MSLGAGWDGHGQVPRLRQEEVNRPHNDDPYNRDNQAKAALDSDEYAHPKQQHPGSQVGKEVVSQVPPLASSITQNTSLLNKTPQRAAASTTISSITVKEFNDKSCIQGTHEDRHRRLCPPGTYFASL